MKRNAMIVGACAVVAVTGIVCYRLGKARADGIPADADALAYTGYLEDGNGQPVSASLPINVAVYGVEQSGQALCETNPGPTPKSVTVEKGRFRVGLPAACVAEVRKSPNLWLQVNVGTEALGPRTRIAAVAYAVEAERARTAVNPGSGITSLAAFAAAAGACSSIGPTSGTQAVLPFRFSADTGAVVCARDGQTQKTCKAAFQVAVEPNEEAYAGPLSCSGVYVVPGTFACCDD
jgi:hypothetical protein